MRRLAAAKFGQGPPRQALATPVGFYAPCLALARRVPVPPARLCVPVKQRPSIAAPITYTHSGAVKFIVDSEGRRPTCLGETNASRFGVEIKLGQGRGGPGPSQHDVSPQPGKRDYRLGEVGRLACGETKQAYARALSRAACSPCSGPKIVSHKAGSRLLSPLELAFRYGLLLLQGREKIFDAGSFSFIIHG